MLSRRPACSADPRSTGFILPRGVSASACRSPFGVVGLATGHFDRRRSPDFAGSAVDRIHAAPAVLRNFRKAGSRISHRALQALIFLNTLAGVFGRR